jgi:hypothetical protein
MQRFWSRLLLIVASLVSASLHAQQDDAAGSSFADDLVEGTRLHAALETGVNYTDNFFYARNTSNDERATGLIVQPEALLTHVVPRFKFFGGANGEFAWFDLPGNVDDYIDHEFKLGSEWQPAFRHRFAFTSGIKNDHNPFGTERTENTALEDREIDEWQQTLANVSYHYGLPSDRYNLELRAGGQNKEYSNNREVTQYLDYEIASAQIFGFYNIGPKTSVYATVAAQRSYYEEIAPGAFDRGANTVRYLLGGRWLATGKTSGDIVLGYVTRNANDPDRDEFRRLDWQAEITWAPRPVREFKLTTGRRSQESFLNTVDFIDNRYAGITWSEQWTARLQTQLGGRYVESAFIGSTRVDDTVGYKLSGEFRVTQYLKLLGHVSNDQRDSDVNFANYDRLYAYLGARYAR